MKKIWIIVLVLAVIMVLVILGAFFFVSPKSPNTSTTVQNPFGGLSSTTQQGVGGVTSSITTPLKTGSVVVIPDLTKVAQPPGYTPAQGYQIGGSDTGNFQVLYFPAKNAGTDRFLISLFTEPLGQTRLQAEAALRTMTHLSDTQLCSLADVEVWTTPDVNTNYAGHDLGLSFCPGATPLP